MEKKSNGLKWRSYIRRELDIMKIETFLGNAASASDHQALAGLGIPLEALMNDTDYTKAPTVEWYTIHTCVQGKNKWDQGLVAWGLNRTRIDMYKLQYEILSHIMGERGRAIKKKKMVDMSLLPLDHLDTMFARAYQNMTPRFADTIVPTFWYVAAQHKFLAKCERSVISMLKRGFYDEESCRWTEAGTENWNDLYNSSDSPEELVRPSFALVKDTVDMPPQNAFPTIQCMPSELLARVLDYALDPPVLGQESSLAKTSSSLQAHARDWSRRQTVTIRAHHWLYDPPERFPTGKLPVEWLQSLKKVQFDFHGVDYSRRQMVHPVMEQLAEIWKEKNELQSLVLPVGPDMKYLMHREPRMELDPAQKSIFAPLLEIPDIKPEYTVDFGAPVNVWGYNALCELARPRNRDSERSLRLILGKAQSSINAKCGEDGSSPLHISVRRDETKITELLLDTPGIDINTQDMRGDTAFDLATVGGYVDHAMLLTRHDGFRATESNFANALRYLRDGRLLFALCKAHGAVPSCVANNSWACEVLNRLGWDSQDCRSGINLC